MPSSGHSDQVDRPANPAQSALTAPRDETFDAYVVRRVDDADPPRLDAGVERMKIDDLPEGEVLIAVEWSALNYKDSMVSAPGNRVARNYPLVPGVDLAGRVVSSSEPGIATGSSVLAHGHELGVARHGGFARFARVPAEWVVPLSGGIDTRSAMVLGTAAFTAALSVDELERHGLTSTSGPVLVTGAAGGVGSMSVAILARRGYEVVASTGRSEQSAWLKSLGAARIVGRDEVDDQPGRVLGTQLWAGAVDCVGGSTLARVLRSLNYGAAVAASGLTGGSTLECTVFPFITRQVALLGIDSVATPRSRRIELWNRLSDDSAVWDIENFVDEEITLAGVGAALERIRKGAVRGRVVVRLAD